MRIIGSTQTGTYEVSAALLNRLALSDSRVHVATKHSLQDSSRRILNPDDPSAFILSQPAAPAPGCSGWS